MPVPWSVELAQIFADANDIAAQTRKPFDSSHLLIAIFMLPNRAQAALRERGIDEDTVSDLLDAVSPESPEVVPTIRERARQIAESQGWSDVDCLHLLIAFARTRESRAYHLLSRCSVDLVQLRTQLLSYFTSGNIPRRLGGSRGAPPAQSSAHQARQSPPPQRPTTPPARSVGQPTISGQNRLEGSDDAQGRVGRIVSNVAAGAARAFATVPRAEVVTKVAVRPEQPECPVALDQREYPWLKSLGRNLSQLAWEERLDPLIGREIELESVLDILHKRRANNPCLVGEPGVGKTALVEGLAVRLLEEDATQNAPGAHIIIELNMGMLLAGTHLRGSFSERMNGVQAEVKRASGRVVVFIDEIHNLIGAGATGDSSQDAANELKAALARGDFPCIGATTIEEYRKYIEKDPALARRFQLVELKEPTTDEALNILRGVVPHYESHHNVSYRPEAIAAAVALSSRYIIDRRLPDKAIAVIDHAGARTRREGRTEVHREDIARAVASAARLPPEKLVRDEDRIHTLEADLARLVVGQSRVIAAVADTLRRNLAGFHGERPVGTFLFVGPPGVGKTLLASAIAECLYEARDAVVRFDMGEFSDGLSVSRMVGAAPGYVGHDRGGELTEALRRRPHQVVLFDDIERAHQDILPLLIQILDEARLTDARGRVADFRNAIVVLTSRQTPLGGGRRGSIGFGAASPREDPDSANDDATLAAAASAISPALWARVAAKLAFRPLAAADLAEIVRRDAAASSAQLEKERGIQFALDGDAVALVVASCAADPAEGARPLRTAFQRLVESPIAQGIVDGELARGDTVTVRRRDDQLVFVKANTKA